MASYCNRQRLEPSVVTFRFDGSIVRESDTPESLEMEDEDTIEVSQ